MAWDHLSITRPHLVYIILGGFTSLFMLCSSVIKERMYIGEATVATLVGVIFGPHAANLINPLEWGNVDLITLEFSRIVLVVQCFAVGVELPKFYMEKHWKSVVFLLVPVMAFGWLVTSLFIFWMIDSLSWLDSLVVAACVTATDPVLASSVVGKGKFAKRVPKHLRDLLSAESGCNDGMAFPFIYLAVYLLQDHMSAKEVTFHWFVYTILYECIFGAIFGFLVGYIARHGIKLAEKHDLIDRESFLVFYFVLALFCAGSGSMLGLDDLLVGFAAGVGFSNDGWFASKTEESHVSNVIDLLLNLAYFVYLGTIIPWEMYNSATLGLEAWRLVVIAIFVLLFRRLPIMLALKPFIPDVKTWREAFFAGHFGPIGVGAIFVAILARSELAYETTTPLSDHPPEDSEHNVLVGLIWPIVTFLVITSIIVHGSSVAVFTLGKRINTLTLTMSYTTAPEDGPSWMNRLPRIASQSRSQARTMSDTSVDDLKLPEFPPGTLPPVGIAGQFLRRQKDEDGNKPGSRSSSQAARRKRRKWDDGIGPGGPVTQSAIFPARRAPTDMSARSEKEEDRDPSPHTRPTPATERDPEKASSSEPSSSEFGPSRGPSPPRLQVYEEGDKLIVENQDGDVVRVLPSPEPSRDKEDAEEGAGIEAEKRKKAKVEDAENAEAQEQPTPLPQIQRPGGRLRSVSETGAAFNWTLDSFKRKMSDVYYQEVEKRKEREKAERRHEPARAFQFGNTIIVEDEDGEVIKTYDLQKPEEGRPDLVAQSLKYMGLGGLVKPGDKAPEGSSTPDAEASGTAAAAQKTRKKSVAEVQQEDDRNIRFTIGGAGQRMTKDDFIREMQKLDTKTRREVVDHSSASHVVKTLAKQDPAPRGGAAAPTKSTASPKFQPQATESAGRTARDDDSGSDIGPRDVRGKRREADSPLRAGRAHRSEDEDADDSDYETPAERKRRLAVLNRQADDDTGETPAERRRREAALGMSARGGEEEDDSEDEGTERVPPARRGIRFADVPEQRGRKS